MEATLQALCKHGYPSTTISNIAEEFDKSKSLLYYHYEDKEELLEDVLRFLLDHIEDELAAIDADDPEQRLQAIIDQLLPPDIDDEELAARRAILEVQSQAPHQPRYYEQFEEFDRLLLAELTASIEHGVETGQFVAVDPEQTAELLYALVYGILVRAVTFDDPAMIAAGRSMVREYVTDSLRAADATPATASS